MATDSISLQEEIVDTISNLKYPEPGTAEPRGLLLYHDMKETTRVGGMKAEIKEMTYDN